MNYNKYAKYISAETLMGPNSVRIIAELFGKQPLLLATEDRVLDLGCGKGLTSLVIAKETGARVYANDLWIPAEENEQRFEAWGVGNQITPICEDAGNLRFDQGQFQAMVSIDSYHYFAGSPGFFESKLLPVLREGATVLIGIPGIKNEYAGRSEELLSAWLGNEAKLFKSPEEWKAIIGNHARIEKVSVWEMECSGQAWEDWLAMEQEFACGDRQHYEALIRPYTCLIGICIKLK